MKFTEMPNLIISQTLSYLPVDDLYRIQLTNKSIYNIIHSRSNLWLKSTAKCFFSFDNSPYGYIYTLIEPINHIESILTSKKQKWIELVQNYVRVTKEWENVLGQIMPNIQTKDVIKRIFQNLKNPNIPFIPLRREDLGRFCSTIYQQFLCDKIFEENTDNLNLTNDDQKLQYYTELVNIQQCENVIISGLDPINLCQSQIFQQLLNSDKNLLHQIRWYMYGQFHNQKDCCSSSASSSLASDELIKQIYINDGQQEYEDIIFNNIDKNEIQVESGAPSLSEEFDKIFEINFGAQKCFIIQMYQALQNTINNHCEMILEYILSQNNIYNVLSEYIGRWNAYIASILEFEEQFKPFINLMNQVYNEIFKYYPKFPKFSLWRLMVKVWIRIIHKRLKKYLNISFLQIMNHHFEKNLSSLMNEVNIGQSTKIKNENIFTNQFNDIPLTLYLEFQKLKKKGNNFPYELNVNNELYQDNPGMENELLKSYIQCIIDISVNEVNIHYIGSTKRCFDKPYQYLEKQIIQKSRKFIQKNLPLFVNQPVQFQEFLNSNLNLVSRFLPECTKLALEKIINEINIDFIETYTQKEIDNFLKASTTKVTSKKVYSQDNQSYYVLENFMNGYLKKPNKILQKPIKKAIKRTNFKVPINNNQRQTTLDKSIVRQIIDSLMISFPKICSLYQNQKEKQILLNNYKTEADYLIFAENKKRNIPYGMSEIDQNFYILSKDTCLTQLKNISENIKQIELDQQSTDIQDSLSSQQMIDESSMDLSEGGGGLGSSLDLSFDLEPITLFQRSTGISNNKINTDFQEIQNLQREQELFQNSLMEEEAEEQINYLNDLPELTLFKR